MSYFPSPLGRDNATADAFSRLRVSNPTGLFDSQHQYDANPLRWVGKATFSGSVAHDAANSVTVSILGNLPLALDVDGANPLVLSVCATCAALNGDVDASLNWTEFR